MVGQIELSGERRPHASFDLHMDMRGATHVELPTGELEMVFIIAWDDGLDSVATLVVGVLVATQPIAVHVIRPVPVALPNVDPSTCHRGAGHRGLHGPASVHAHIDALYGQIPTGALPADVETAAMTRLRHEAHARMLGNGRCTRPAELDCRMETACETCAYFATGREFFPVLLRQRDHARDHHQTDRVDLFNTLIQRAETRS